MSPWIVLVTLAALLVYFYMGIEVARARQKFNVPAPATTGNADFERAYRVQMNTLEWIPLYLVTLWLSAMYWDPRIMAAIGAVWIVGRLIYMHGYLIAANQRSLGFLIQGTTVLVLFLLCLVGAIMGLVQGG